MLFRSLVFMILGPGILVSLHTLCTKASCTLKTPTISKDLKTYYNLEAIMMYSGFWAILKVLKFLPVGAVLNGQRMNGFASLLVLLSAVPALVYYKVPLGAVKEKYFFFMSTAIVLSFVCADLLHPVSLGQQDQPQLKGQHRQPHCRHLQRSHPQPKDPWL